MGALPLLDEPPSGLIYHPEFISEVEEQALLTRVREVAFADFEMRGQVARRRVAFFGETYGRTDAPAVPIPEFLFAVRDRLARRADVPATAFVMALINEYPVDAPIGWHRDAPQYGIVAGLSLLSPCRMRFRPYQSPHETMAGQKARMAAYEITLAPRSAYLLSAAARQDYEHSIPAVTSLRYSITFRTRRGGDSRG
jgi:alkylated DNA repair protein (DNA oxidative demethylase)